ncbi:MAG: carboxypeptidase-like regulatory domain-containing protein, partial [Vicinamibacterales bacterium]
MPTLFLASVVVALFLAVATPAAQQGTSEIRGRVVDQNGAVLPGVTVVLTNEDTGVFRETISGADGSYFATQLIPGRYRIDATLSGFKKLEQPGLVL